MKRKLLILFLCLFGILNALSFGKNKVNRNVQQWSHLSSTHFDIYYPKGEDEFGQTVALMSENIYYYLKETFKYPLFGRIPVVFYPTKSDFQATNIIYPLLSEGVGGFTESLRNRVAIPFDGSYVSLEKLLIHELTHAYSNALDSRISVFVESLRPQSFPFWFSEGLPEYLSVGGKECYNNMFIIDSVIAGKAPRLDYIEGYLAYRAGESFLVFIAETYGKDKVSEFFYTMRTIPNYDDASKKVFGMKFDELQSRWHYELKRRYFPYVNTHQNPAESYEKRTDHKEDGSYLNHSPRFSPDGSRYVYFSDQGARSSIWLAGTHGLAKPVKLITGEKSAKIEEFYFKRSNLAWFPDGRRIAFVAKTSDGDRIHILDVDSRKIIRSIALKDLSAIYELDISPDGTKLAISAQIQMQSDIFIYDLDSDELWRITEDNYADIQPRFSPDGTKVIFSSERSISGKARPMGYFTSYKYDIFEYDLFSGAMLQLTDHPFSSYSPMYLAGGKQVIYTSERDGIANLEIIDLESHKRAKLTEVLSGVLNADISPDGNYLIFSNYFEGGWDLYLGISPLEELSYSFEADITPYQPFDKLLSDIDLSELSFYGPRTKLPIDKSTPAYQPVERPFIGSFEPALPDTNIINKAYYWDERPKEPSDNPPVIRKYKPSFSLDSLWGGAAYSSSYGIMGNIEVGLSDLMGDHGIGISLGLSDKLDELSFVLSYLSLKRRTDWGAGLFNFYDEYYFRIFNSGAWDYLRLRQRETGAYGVIRYPFSKFSRIEFDNMLFQYHSAWDWLPNANIENEEWIEDYDSVKGITWQPGLSYVYDTALYGSTGPLSGDKAILNVQKGFAKNDQDYLTYYADIRHYHLFSKRYALAYRLNAGLGLGNSPSRFSLGGYNGIRALTFNLAGRKKVLTTLELRYPLLDHLSLAFPLPITLSSIRGSAYVDVGAVWDDNAHFKGTENGVLKDIKLGYGFGPRINLGLFVLKLDISWLSDLSQISKPQIYLSLSEDF